MNPAPKQVMSGVFFGDHYLCAGQSNMVLDLRQDMHYLSPQNERNHSEVLRFQYVKSAGFMHPDPLLRGASDAHFHQKWTRVDHETARFCSAVCYHFAESIPFGEMGVAVGLTVVAEGGQTIEAFVSGEARAGCRVENQLRADENWVMPDHVEDGGNWRSLALLLKLATKGVLWYQGEADTQQQASARLNAFCAGDKNIGIRDGNTRMGLSLLAVAQR